MKRNIILLISILLTAILVGLLYSISFKKNFESIDGNNLRINKGYEDYFETKVKVENGKLTLTGPKGTKELTINDKIYSASLSNDNNLILISSY